jgi:polyhydroxybutyrate depolymerase
MPKRLASGAVGWDDAVHHLVRDGRTRRYLVHRPADDPAGPLPVVLLFHGGLGRAEVQRTQSGMNEVADRAGFLAVYPDGTGLMRTHLTWNAGTCCGYAVRRGVDDVGFVDRLIDDLSERYPVNPRRIYASGMSNGAMLCYRLACELSDRITAIGPVAGDMGVTGPVPTRPVPLIHFHGLEDQNSCFHGGVGTNQIQPLPHRSIPEGIAWWRDVNRCAPEPEIREETDCSIERYAPPAGEPGAPVILYKLPHGGHTWPGGVDVTPHLNTGRLVASVNASALMWEFFRRFEL